MKWEDVKSYLDILSVAEKKVIDEIRFEKDKLRTLVGRILLLDILNQNTHWKYNVLPKLYYSEYEKPFIEPKLDLGCFNISHSEDLVACGYVKDGDIGVDVEKVVSVDVDEFKEVLTKEEYNLLKLKPNSYFFKVWTLKEAIIKALGTGFYLDPCSFSIPIHLPNEFNIVVENKKLEVQRLNLNDNYIISIAKNNGENINLVQRRIY